MTDNNLTGQRVLVTRPAAQSQALIVAIESAAGNPVRFPSIAIQPREPSLIRTDLARANHPDIVVFVSRNAVELGWSFLDTEGAQLAAIGPATCDAIEQQGRKTDIFPQQSFDSEGLLAHPALREVADSNILIVRGNLGRELLAATLQERGAVVSELAVYERVAASPTAQDLAELRRAGATGGIDYVVAMSIESLTGLLQILPDDCRGMLSQTLLVTPSKRVIQTCGELLPDTATLLADGPQADDLVDAMIRSRAGADRQ